MCAIKIKKKACVLLIKILFAYIPFILLLIVKPDWSNFI